MASAISGTIFKRVGKRILDPYRCKVTLEVRRKDNDEVKLQEQVRVITMAQVQRRETVHEEASPLQDLIDGFHRDIKIQDSVEIVRTKTVPKAPKATAKPVAKQASGEKPTRREARDDRREANHRRWDEQNARAMAAREANRQTFAAEKLEDSSDSGEEEVVTWTQDQFWTWIAGLGWGDRSDNPNVRTAETIARRMSDSKKRGMMAIYEQLYTNLAGTLDTFLRGYDMGEDNRKAILSHIIAKGENFYNAICADPDFASYLISDASRPAENNEFIDFSKLL